MFNAQPVKIPQFKRLLTLNKHGDPIFLFLFAMFISWMLIKPSFKKSLIVEQFQGNCLKRKFLRPKNTSSTFLKFELSRLGGPMRKTRKNTIRNQFQQQWFHVISFQKPRRVYIAIWYKLMPLAIKKGRFKGAMSPHTHARANENKLEKVGLSFSSFVGDFGRLFLSV